MGMGNAHSLPLPMTYQSAAANFIIIIPNQSLYLTFPSYPLLSFHLHSHYYYFTPSLHLLIICLSLRSFSN